MKTMRKIFTLVLAMTMLLSLAVTAHADETTAPIALTDTGTVSIVGAASGTQYTFYRIFDIAKTTDNNENVYITNTKWDTFAEAESAKADGYFTISSDYLKVVTIDSNATDAEIQQFAASVVAYAETNSVEPDGQTAKLTTSGTFTNLVFPYGYYIMVSDRVDNPKYSVFVLDGSNVQVTEKNAATASIQKFVQEDSQAGNADGGWGASNAAEIEQEIRFKIVVTAAAGTDKYVVTDTLPNFEAIENVSYTYSRGEIPTNGLVYQEITDGFTVTFGDTFRALLEDGDTITIEYTAKLKPTATIAGTGNVNTATLTCGETTGTPASTTTFTYKVNVTKVDENNQSLAGATFTLSHDNSNLHFSVDSNDSTNYIVDPDGKIEQITTDATGEFSISGLDSMDEYILTETAAPEPYILMDPYTVIIQPDGSGLYTRDVTVQNLPGVDMPTTGGMGTTMFYVIGGVLVLAAVVLLVTKKRARA